MGTMPTAVMAPSGEITVTESPGNTPRLRASSRPSKIAGAPSASGSIEPCRSCERTSSRTAGAARSTPRIKPPRAPPFEVVKSAC